MKNSALASGLLGVDTGGTFTDFVFYHQGRLQVHKVLSTPDAPEKAILQGIKEMAIDTRGLTVIHGSTVATNAVLQGRGVRTVYIGNRGFRDLLAIGRQARKSLYDLCPVKTESAITDELCLETGGRISADGDILEPVSDQDLVLLRQQIEQLQPRSVAINLLFSYLQPQLEQQIRAALPDDLFVSCSSEVLPEYREFERGMTTWLNAWVGPLVQGYLQRLQVGVAPARVAVMQSSAGTMDAEQAGLLAVNMLLSGPAGGLMAARYIGRQLGLERLMTFDMGGTSTDVALIDGDIRMTCEGSVGDYPVAVPMVDMHTIGAGGGSLATMDSAGLLHVGPQSAGADPGPACYGGGGTQATVTDANLVLGRLRADSFLGGQMQLDAELARTAIRSLAQAMQCTIEQAAEGIIRVANEHMVRALRVISMQRGMDPRDFTLTCFGGAGGLHVCALADTLRIQQVLVPMYGGVLSALGMLVTPVQRQHSLTVSRAINTVDSVELQRLFQPLIDKGVDELVQEGQPDDAINIRRSLDCRYCGQSYTLNVVYDEGGSGLAESIAAFHESHQKTYGHRLDQAVDLVNIRVVVSAPDPEIEMQAHHNSQQLPLQYGEMAGQQGPVALYQREQLQQGQVLSGPCLVMEKVATTYIASGWHGEVQLAGHLLLSRGA